MGKWNPKVSFTNGAIHKYFSPIWKDYVHINSNATAIRECNFVMGTNSAKGFCKIVSMAKLDIYG